jgi:transcriptional regulator with PAS, ATPase and Fis domain
MLREDLYYRLNVFHISLPPLRERKQDLPDIGNALIRDLNRKHGCRVTHLSPEVLRRFDLYWWPGNVRELRNVLERAIILAGEGEIQIHHLPVTLAEERKPSSPESATDDGLKLQFGARMKDVEEAYIGLTLRHTNGSRKRAAEILGISLHTLYNKLRLYRDKMQDQSLEVRIAPAEASNSLRGSLR